MALVVEAITAVSIDGYIARHADETDAERLASGFACLEDQKHLRSEMATADAVVIGARTLKAANGLIFLENQFSQPHWYVATRTLDAASCNQFCEDRINTTFVVPKDWGNDDIRNHDLTLVRYTHPSNWPETVMQDCKSRGFKKLLVLGGASVYRDFFSSGLVDRLTITILPILIAQKEAVPFIESHLVQPLVWHLTSSNVSGDIVFLRYQRKSSG